jgi:hypothetical protein
MSISRITCLNGLTVYRSMRGILVVPIQSEYVAWTGLPSDSFTALQAKAFTPIKDI